MDIFGIGPLELILVLILALVVFGPNKLPEIGSKLGSALRDMRKATREFSQELDETRQVLEGLQEPIREITGPLQTTGDALSSARELVTHPGKAIESYVMGQYAAGTASSEADAAAEAPSAEPAAAAETPDPGVSAALAALETAFPPAADDASTALATPAEQADAPEQTTPAPTEAPADGEPAVESEASPALPPAPVKDTLEIAASVEETAAPVGEVVLPTFEIAAPIEEIAQLVSEIAAPVEEIAPPAVEITAPVEEITASAIEIVAPVGDASAPTDAPAPLASRPDPVVEAAQPVAPTTRRSRHRAAPKIAREAETRPENTSALSVDGPAPQD